MKRRGRLEWSYDTGKDFLRYGDFGDGDEGEAGTTNSTEMLATSRFIKGVFDLVCTRANNRQPSIVLYIFSLLIVTNYLTVLTVNGPAPHFRQKADKVDHSGLYASHPGDGGRCW